MEKKEEKQGGGVGVGVDFRPCGVFGAVCQVSGVTEDRATIHWGTQGEMFNKWDQKPGESKSHEKSVNRASFSVPSQGLTEALQRARASLYPESQPPLMAGLTNPRAVPLDPQRQLMLSASRLHGGALGLSVCHLLFLLPEQL